MADSWPFAFHQSRRHRRNIGDFMSDEFKDYRLAFRLTEDDRRRLDLRQRSIERARLSAIPTNPRWGRVMRACRRALIANQSASVSQIREWAYCGQPYQTWHCHEIRRALKQLTVPSLPETQTETSIATN
jgi:predicted aminopeptidase